MSATENEQTPLGEARSSLSLNSKGEVQIETKVRVGDEPADVTLARVTAETNFDLLRAKYRPAP